MKAEGSGHYLRAVSDGAGMVHNLQTMEMFRIIQEFII